MILARSHVHPTPTDLQDTLSIRKAVDNDHLTVVPNSLERLTEEKTDEMDVWRRCSQEDLVTRTGLSITIGPVTTQDDSGELKSPTVCCHEEYQTRSRKGARLPLSGALVLRHDSLSRRLSLFRWQPKSGEFVN